MSTPKNVLVIGGTGLISVGIVKHLLPRGCEVTLFNRGKRGDETLPDDARSAVRTIHGDRNDEAALTAAASSVDGGWDAVIDMVCFTPAQAEAAVRAFAGRCGHFLFCSTVCTYGAKIPPTVLIDEDFPQEPVSGYGRNKLACERTFLDAGVRGDFAATVVRPSHTYGPGAPLIDNLEADARSWGRIERGEPVLCAGDGLGLWVSTHRDDVGKLFAHAAGNPATHGRCYNATRDPVLTWSDYYAQVATALGRPADVRYLPADTILAADPDGKRFGLLREITRYHGAYTSARAKADVPEFRCDIDLPTGAAETIADLKRRDAFKTGEGDAVYDGLIAKT